MKISYILQLKDFSIMLLFGILLGIFYGIINISSKIKFNIIIQIFVDIFFSITSVTIFILLINKINRGEFRTFLSIGYLLGFLIERISIGKLFAKRYKIMYNTLVNLLNKVKNTKVGRFFSK